MEVIPNSRDEKEGEEKERARVKASVSWDGKRAVREERKEKH